MLEDLDVKVVRVVTRKFLELHRLPVLGQFCVNVECHSGHVEAIAFERTEDLAEMISYWKPEALDLFYAPNEDQRSILNALCLSKDRAMMH
jgi:hypothetical protein